MNPLLAEALLAAAGLYLGIGLAFAVAFVTIGVARVDANAAGTGAGFRLLLLPGATALWPLLAARWRDGRHEPPEQHDPHTDAARRRRGDA